MSKTLEQLLVLHRDRHDRLMHEAIDDRMSSETLEEAQKHQKTAMEHAHKAGALDAVLDEYSSSGENQ